MIEVLTIENFGPIKKVALELRALNIFIGDQSTGKSTIAKLLFAIKETLTESDNGENFKNSNFDRFQNQLEWLGILKLCSGGKFHSIRWCSRSV